MKYMYIRLAFILFFLCEISAQQGIQAPPHPEEEQQAPNNPPALDEPENDREEKKELNTSQELQFFIILSQYMAEEQVAIWDAELELNTTQEIQFLNIILDYNEKLERLRRMGHRPDNGTEMLLMAEISNELKSCLTRKQKRFFERFIKENRPPEPQRVYPRH
jgi:hypothetical protein